jgi:ribosomal protein L34
MDYKEFTINAFEREPGKWRARVRRASGRSLITTRRTKMQEFITGIDADSASKAMVMAMDAIDAGAFSGRGARSSQKPRHPGDQD